MITDDQIRKWWESGARGGADVRDMMHALGQPFGPPFAPPTDDEISAARAKIAAAIPAARLDALIAAARALSQDVVDVGVGLLPSGNVTVHVRLQDAAAVSRLAAELGCGSPTWATDGRHEWACAERGEYGDPVVLTVTGGHRAVCQCHPRKAG